MVYLNAIHHRTHYHLGHHNKLEREYIGILVIKMDMLVVKTSAPQHLSRPRTKKIRICSVIPVGKNAYCTIVCSVVVDRHI